MLQNYVTIALRNLRRHRGYTFLNIAGLAAGIAGCLLILLYVQDERSFDRFHPRAEDTYRVVETRRSPDLGERHGVYPMGPLGPALAASVPEVEASVRLVSSWLGGRRTVERGTARFYVGDYLFTEPSFFDVFDFALLRGDPATALAEPLSVVLTEASARTYFGEEDPIGQTLHFERYGEVTVTGVLADPPAHSHLRFSMLFSFATLHAIDGWQRWMEDWASEGFVTYVVLREGASVAAVEQAMSRLVTAHGTAEEEHPRRVGLQPLVDVHFGSAHIEDDLNEGKGSLTYVYLFSAIALFVLAIACINYMNLATARALRRAREVGLRKVVGARRGQLVVQFLGESVVTALLALAVALILVYLFLPAFSALAGRPLALQVTSGTGVVLLLALALAVGILSGSYPALYLSRFGPAAALKGGAAGRLHGGGMRRLLVATQFTLSMLLIAATLVVYKQMRFVQERRLGFNEEQLVVVDINSRDVRSAFATVKAEMARHPGVQAVSVSSHVPGDWKDIPQVEVADAAGQEPFTMHYLGIDADFLDTYEIALVAGRTLADDASDSAAVLLNETAARLLGWTEPLGQTLRVEDPVFRGRVVGVVRDFHYRSLHEPIGPMVLGHRMNPIDAIDYFSVRFAGAEGGAVLAHLQAVGERFDPAHPFEYNFLDERLNDFYRAEQRAGRLFGVAALLALLIACLGLLGLTAFAVEQRTKEIAVRKVLGASVTGLAALVATDIAKLIALSFLVAAPVAGLVMHRWLEGFAYRTSVDVGTLSLAGLVTLVVALTTVGYQALRAALADPVAGLRSE